MVNIGDVAKRVNSQKYQVFIGTADADNYQLLQNASLSLTHSEFREPTTGGGIVYYSGLPDNVLSGTILYTSDFLTGSAVGDIQNLLTTTNGEYATFPIKVKLTAADSTISTFTFASAKLTSCVIYKGVEGAAKADISFVLLSDPVLGTV